jgi:hypothetical protein
MERDDLYYTTPDLARLFMGHNPERLVSTKDPERPWYRWRPATLLWEALTPQAVKQLIFQVLDPVLTQKRLEYEAHTDTKHRSRRLKLF